MIPLGGWGNQREEVPTPSRRTYARPFKKPQSPRNILDSVGRCLRTFQGPRIFPLSPCYPMLDLFECDGQPRGSWAKRHAEPVEKVYRGATWEKHDDLVMTSSFGVAFVEEGNAQRHLLRSHYPSASSEYSWQPSLSVCHSLDFMPHPIRRKNKAVDKSWLLTR